MRIRDSLWPRFHPIDPFGSKRIEESIKGIQEKSEGKKMQVSKPSAHRLVIFTVC